MACNAQWIKTLISKKRWTYWRAFHFSRALTYLCRSKMQYIHIAQHSWRTQYRSTNAVFVNYNPIVAFHLLNWPNVIDKIPAKRNEWIAPGLVQLWRQVLLDFDCHMFVFVTRRNSENKWNTRATPSCCVCFFPPSIGLLNSRLNTLPLFIFF